MAPESVLPAVDAFGGQRAGLVDRIVRLVEADVLGFDGWYVERLLRELAEQVASKVLIGQTGVANLTDAYLSRVTSIVAARTISPVGVDPSLGESLRLGQVNLGDVYMRLGPDFRYRRSLGASPSDALSATATRAGVMADTDMALAHRQQVVDFNKRRKVIRYRRVLRSERPCGLCAAASDRLYRSDSLMPIHGRCRCGVMPVEMANDPGSTLTNDDLAALYKAAGGTSAAALKRVVVEQHGELGPVLTVRGQNFRDAHDVALAA